MNANFYSLKKYIEGELFHIGMLGVQIIIVAMQNTSHNLVGNVKTLYFEYHFSHIPKYLKSVKLQECFITFTDITGRQHINN